VFSNEQEEGNYRMSGPDFNDYDAMLENGRKFKHPKDINYLIKFQFGVLKSMRKVHQGLRACGDKSANDYDKKLQNQKTTIRCLIDIKDINQ